MNDNHMQIYYTRNTLRAQRKRRERLLIINLSLLAIALSTIIF